MRNVKVLALILFFSFVGIQQNTAWELETESEPEAKSEPDTKYEPETEPESESESESESEPESEPESEVESEPESDDPEPEGERFDSGTVRKWITLYSLVIVVIIVGNVLIIVVLLRNKETRVKQANLFFLSLLVARTSVAVLVIPARITGLFSNQLLGSALCKLCHFAGRGSAVTSVLSTTAIALAKYHEIRLPKRPVPLTTSALQLALIWALGYTWAIRAPILNDLFLAETTVGAIWVCAVAPQHAYTNSIFIFIDCVLLFIIPFTIVLFCYFKVIKVLNEKRKETSKTTHEQSSKEKAFLVHVKAIQMLIVVMVLFTVCYSLPYIFRLYIFFTDATLLMSDFAEIEMWVYWVSYANPWLNILAYVVFRDDIREGLKGLCGKKNTKVEPDKCKTYTDQTNQNELES